MGWDQDEGVDLCKVGTMCGVHGVVRAGQGGHGEGGIAPGWKVGIGRDGEDGIRTGCDGERGDGFGTGYSGTGMGWDEVGRGHDEKGMGMHRDRVECGGSWMALRMEWGKGSLWMESDGIRTRWDKDREETWQGEGKIGCHGGQNSMGTAWGGIPRSDGDKGERVSREPRSAGREPAGLGRPRAGGAAAAAARGGAGRCGAGGGGGARLASARLGSARPSAAQPGSARRGAVPPAHRSAAQRSAAPAQPH